MQDAETLRHLYFCVQAGIQKCSHDGVSPAHLHPLAVLIRRAYMSASGHEHPVYALAEEHSFGQDNDWLSVAEAAAELGLGERQVRRIAKAGLGTRKGREWRLPRSKVLPLKQKRDSRRMRRRWVSIDSYIAALTDDQVDALLGVPAHRSWNAIRRNKRAGRLLGRPCLLYTSPSPRDKRQSRMPSSA